MGPTCQVSVKKEKVERVNGPEGLVGWLGGPTDSDWVNAGGLGRNGDDGPTPTSPPFFFFSSALPLTVGVRMTAPPLVSDGAAPHDFSKDDCSIGQTN